MMSLIFIKSSQENVLCENDFSRLIFQYMGEDACEYFNRIIRDCNLRYEEMLSENESLELKFDEKSDEIQELKEKIKSLKSESWEKSYKIDRLHDEIEKMNSSI